MQIRMFSIRCLIVNYQTIKKIEIMDNICYTKYHFKRARMCTTLDSKEL